MGTESITIGFKSASLGVGKLAAYSLGKRLTHIATIKNVTRVVSVGESQLKDRHSPPTFNGPRKAKESEGAEKR